MILGPAQVLEIGATSATAYPLQVPGVLHGWAWRNTSATAPATFELRDGPTGALIVPFTLCPGESVRDWLSGTGIEIVTGLALTAVTGTVVGSLWFRTFPHNAAPLPIDVHALVDRIIDGMFGG